MQSCPHHVFPTDAETAEGGEAEWVEFMDLLRVRSFEWVELPHLGFECRVAIQKRGLCPPCQKKITDYFMPLVR